MNDRDDAMIASLARQILIYLDSHPAAADSLNGVARWWLADSSLNTDFDTLSQALDDLVDRGLVLSRSTPDGQVIYSRTAPGDDAKQGW